MTNATARDQISEAVGTDGDGAMFDETIVAYKKVRGDAERLMIGSIRSQFPHIMRPYTQRPSWTTVDTDPDSCESWLCQRPLPQSMLIHSIASRFLSITAELDQPLEVRRELLPSNALIVHGTDQYRQMLKQALTFLSGALAPAPLRRITSAFLATLQDILWQDVLVKENFTTLGAAQLSRDLAAICDLVDSYIPNGSMTFLKLKEGVLLLDLPLVADESATGGVTAGEAEAERRKTMSVGEAYERCFESNGEAKKVLEELGLEAITHLEARNVLNRRVECVE